MTDSDMLNLPDASEQYIVSENGRLRCGFTTGSCAAMAALASVRALLTGSFPEYAQIVTLKGWRACAEVTDCSVAVSDSGERSASCAVCKDSGDDPDVTDGTKIFSTVTLVNDNNKKNSDSVDVIIKGGKGVGVVTKSGLDQPVGEYAVNSVPRKMICDAVRTECMKHGFTGKASVTIEVPDGESLALKTFNPYLGIKGGISILGTSGVVEPMSESALISSIETEMKVLAESLKENKSCPLILTPGNYGSDFIKSHPEFDGLSVVKCSNYIGKALDFAVAYGFTEIIAVGHAGKFVKLAGGIMNTHSNTADCRMEIIACHAALLGADQADVARILGCATVDAAFDILDESLLTSSVIKSISRSACRHIFRRIKGAVPFRFIMFTNTRGCLS